MKLEELIGEIVLMKLAGSPESVPAMVCHANADGSLNLAPFGPDGVMMPGVRGSLYDESGEKPLHWRYRAAPVSVGEDYSGEEDSAPA